MGSRPGVGYNTPASYRVHGWVSFLLTAIGAVVVLGAFLLVLEVFLFAPWAYPLSRRPPLVGTWVDDFRTPSGVNGAVFFDIRHRMGQVTSARSSRGLEAKLEGEERWCFPHGKRETYALSGSADSDAENIWVEYDYSPKAGSPGVYFSAVEGTLVDYRLQLYGTAAVYDGKAFVGVAKDPDVATPTKFFLHPGTESDFSSLCQQLK